MGWRRFHTDLRDPVTDGFVLVRILLIFSSFFFLVGGDESGYLWVGARPLFPPL